jgi:hypothetical protein
VETTGKLDAEEVACYLAAPPPVTFLEVQRRVFATRLPFPAEVAYQRNHFFLGIARSMVEDHPYEPAAPQWGPWEVSGVAYPVPDEYPAGIAADLGFWQFGLCRACGLSTAASMKHSLCPACGAKVYGT